jgi:hypothetical protein
LAALLQGRHSYVESEEDQVGLLAYQQVHGERDPLDNSPWEVVLEEFQIRGRGWTIVL